MWSTLFWIECFTTLRENSGLPSATTSVPLSYHFSSHTFPEGHLRNAKEPPNPGDLNVGCTTLLALTEMANTNIYTETKGNRNVLV